MKINYRLVLILSIIMLSCTNDSTISQMDKLSVKIDQPGFVLSFDDAYIEEWFAIKDTLKQYNVSATFFISGFNNLSCKEIEKLRILKDEKHEIASHSRNHINAISSLQKSSKSDYLKSEILPELNLMKKHGFIVTSFSYPNGHNNYLADSLLLNHFNLLRDVTDFQRHFYSMLFTGIDEIDEIYFGTSSTRVVSALGIDENFKLSFDEIREAFTRAKSKNEIVIFYAHKPVKYINSAYQISYDYLTTILSIASELGLKSYRFSDLNNFIISDSSNNNHLLN